MAGREYFIKRVKDIDNGYVRWNMAASDRQCNDRMLFLDVVLVVISGPSLVLTD